jgi:hypothetical protein
MTVVDAVDVAERLVRLDIVERMDSSSDFPCMVGFGPTGNKNYLTDCLSVCLSVTHTLHITREGRPEHTGNTVDHQRLI